MQNKFLKPLRLAKKALCYIAVTAGGIFATGCLTIGLYRADEYFSVKNGTRLTEKEKALVVSVFGKDIDVNVIRKHTHDREKGNLLAEAKDSRNIHFWGKKYSEADYSQTKDTLNFGTFMHETTHIWQNQKNSFLKDVFKYVSLSWIGKSHIYEYQLTANSRFDDFGIEQQASIMEDYTRRFLYPGGASCNRGVREASTEATDMLLQRVVEKKFPAACKTRLAMMGQKW